MGGRGSGGGRSGGGSEASKSIDAKTENKLNSLLNKSYKYDDEAYDFSRRAMGERALAKRYEKDGKKKLAKDYIEYAKESQKQADKAKAKAKQYRDEAAKLANKKIRDIPRTYQYKGENGVRSVYKSPQNARKAYEQARKSLVSTAYKDHPSIVLSPKGGYSVMPHGIAKLNKLKEISPYSIDMGDS